LEDEVEYVMRCKISSPTPKIISEESLTICHSLMYNKPNQILQQCYSVWSQTCQIAYLSKKLALWH